MTADVSKIEIDAKTRRLCIFWVDGRHDCYHYVWLRHQARCPDGMPNDTRVKIDLLPEDPATLAIEACRVERDSLLIDWGDSDLQTRHGLAALRRSAYGDEARRLRKHHPYPWDGESASRIQVFAHDDLDSERHRLELMLAVRDYGLARLDGVPPREGAIAAVAELFGPLHVNNYGRIFDVRSDASMNLGSNTGYYLPPHTDESYRHDAPGISFFHCLQAAPEGGESLLVDGFMAAARLREEDPRAFELLCSVPLFFQRFAPPDEDMRSHTRVLVTDVDGDVVGVRWTDRTLPPQDLPDDLVEPMYRAIHRFRKIVNAEEMQFRYRLEPGALHIFDNHRVLHGRLAFDPAAGARHLQQCSVNRDEFHNNLRRLAARLGDPAADLVMAGGALG